MRRDIPDLNNIPWIKVLLRLNACPIFLPISYCVALYDLGRDILLHPRNNDIPCNNDIPRNNWLLRLTTCHMLIFSVSSMLSLDEVFAYPGVITGLIVS